MRLKTLPDLSTLKGKRVLLRADFNVPVHRGKVAEDEDWRIKKTEPTVRMLSRAGAKVILASHLGRPEGKKAATLKLAPIAKRLSALLGRDVAMAADCIGPKIEAAIEAMKAGDVLLLENLRFHKGEEANDADFAAQLAGLADVYINEAFGTCHRASASIVGVAERLPAYAGPLLAAEVEALERALKRPERPFLVLMGGAKVSSKIGVIERLLEVADAVLLGGALIAPFYAAQGYGIGATPCEEADLDAAKKLMALKRRDRLMLPVDVVVGHPERPQDPARAVTLSPEPFDLCGRGKAILDVGPRTITAYASQLRAAQTIVWNGPLGKFEVPKYSHGTLALGRLVAARSKGKAFGLVGGGETAVALARTGLMDCVDHVSTGGGAMLEFIEDPRLPGLLPLQR